MNKWFYYSGIRSASLALSDAFTGLTVKKIDGQGKVTETVEVPLRYGLKEKFYYWINDKKQEIVFPIMALHQTQLQYDADRATAKLERFYPNSASPQDRTVWKELINPSPWKLTYNLGIATKFQIELEQILEQILPFFNPFLMINVTIPEIAFSYDAKVILGTVSPETQTTIDIDNTRVVMWNIELTVDTWLFKPVKDVSIIKKIITNLHLKPEDKQIAQMIWDGTADPVSFELRQKDFYEGLPK